MAGKYDEMTFGKAFNAARKAKGSGKTFSWKGKSYTTNLKEEKAKTPAKKTAPKTTARPKLAPTSSARPKRKDGATVPTAKSVTTPKIITTSLTCTSCPEK
jgi:hypothetical protein